MQNDPRRPILLCLLTLVSAFNAVESLILGLALQDIKVELSLTDTRLGLLSGIAFALFYSVMGIPIARWADRGNRAAVISITTALWGIAVTLCGRAQSFVQLAVTRVGVAVGECGIGPTAQSLIGDWYPREELPRAVATYMLGSPLSYLIGYFLGGWLNDCVGWRKTFMIIGIVGMALAALSLVLLEEPRQGRTGRVTVSPGQMSLTAVASTLWTNRTFRHVLACFSVMYFFGAGTGSWQPTFFVRAFGLSTSELGIWLAIILGAGGMLGMYLGGAWAARKAANNEQLQLKVMAVAFVTFAIALSVAYLATHLYLSLACLAFASMGANAAMGPLFAALQNLVPERMRAVAIAIVFLFANLIGAGLGPLAVGWLSDMLRPWTGEQSLRYALVSMCPGYLWAAWHCWRSSLTVGHDLQAARTHHEQA